MATPQTACPLKLRLSLAVVVFVVLVTEILAALLAIFGFFQG
jgi:hypothetical protein